MNKDFTFELSPRGKTRYVAGAYDQTTATPKYTIELSAPSHVRDQVEVKQFLLQNAGGVSWGWDIHNRSTWPVFVTIKRDGGLIALGSSATGDDA